MREKKTEVITVRITPNTRKAIEREAEKREWTPSKMAEKILTSWVMSQQNGSSQAIMNSEISVSLNENTINTVNIL